MENQLKSLNIDQLKAKIYDSMVVIENHQQFIKVLNQELIDRSKEPVVEELDKDIKKDEETKTTK